MQVKLKARLIFMGAGSRGMLNRLRQRIMADDQRRTFVDHETSQWGPWNRWTNLSDTLPLSEGLLVRGEGWGEVQRIAARIISTPQASGFWAVKSTLLQRDCVTSPSLSP